MFTQGKWYLLNHTGDNLNIRSRIQLPDGGETDCNIGIVESPTNNHSEKEANARLIAAAPDLLEACKRVSLMFGCQRLENYPTCEPSDMCCICEAQQAIAKATS